MEKSLEQVKDLRSKINNIFNRLHRYLKETGFLPKESTRLVLNV